jgi:hypothetical protein
MSNGLSNKIKFLALLFCIILLSGCAKKVTNLTTTSVKNVKITLTFAAAPDLNQIEILIPLHSATNPLTPIDSYPTQNPFILHNPKEITDSLLSGSGTNTSGYFANIFNTWEDCIVIRNNSAEIFNGTFVSTQNINTLTASFSQIGNQIILQFSTSQLNANIQAKSAINGTIRYGVYTIDMANGINPYRMEDRLNNLNAFISLIVGTSFVDPDSGAEIQITPTVPMADLLSVLVDIN